MSDHDYEITNDEIGESTSEPDTVLVGTEDAAIVEGIATRTVRKRINTGELTGTKINGAWFVEVSRAKAKAAGIEIPDVDDDGKDISDKPIVGTTRSARSVSGTRPVPQSADLTPMANLIADLNRQVAELSATAGMLQERNRILEEQKQSATLALESGEESHKHDLEAAEAAMEKARAEASKLARDQANAEWRSKSWWQRLKGE